MTEASAGPVAYLTGEYPKASHTFILREIAALEAAGVAVIPCAIRRPRPAELIGPEEEGEHARTFYVIAAARRAPLALVRAHLGYLLRAPGRYLAAAALARRTVAPGAKAALWQLFHFVEAGLLARHLQGRGVRHLHNHFAGSSATVAMLAARMAGLSYSLSLHGPADFAAPDRIALGPKIAGARFAACISHFARAQAMMATDPVHWDRLHIVHCGVEPERYDAPAGDGAGDDTPAGPRLLFVGRLAAVKGLPVLFDALARLRPRHPDLVLEIVGDGPDRTALEERAAARGLGAHVRFLGYRSQAEVAARLTATDVFVLPSFAEGVPVVLMEAMAARRPVVATRVAGVGELVEDGVSGFTVPPGDPESLADRIGLLLDDPARRAAMGAAGRAAVEAGFDIRHEAARLARILAHALDAAAPPLGLRPAVSSDTPRETRSPV